MVPKTKKASILRFEYKGNKNIKVNSITNQFDVSDLSEEILPVLRDEQTYLNSELSKPQNPLTKSIQKHILSTIQQQQSLRKTHFSNTDKFFDFRNDILLNFIVSKESETGKFTNHQSKSVPNKHIEQMIFDITQIFHTQYLDKY